MEQYIIFSLITLILWGLWGFGLKVASSYVDSTSLYVYSAFGSFIISIYFILTSKVILLDDPMKLFIVLFPGLIGALGSILFFNAISQGKASVVIAITATYPLIVSILAFLILREEITLKQAFGIAFSVLGIILLSS